MRRRVSTLSRWAERKPLAAAIGEFAGAVKNLFTMAATIRHARLVVYLGVLLVVLTAAACGFAIGGDPRLQNVTSALAVLALTALVIGGVIFLLAHRFAPKNNERQLELDAILNHLPQGICIFDSAARVVMWNKRYAQMCGLSPGAGKRGLTLGDVLAQRAAAGTFSGNVDQYVAETVREMAEGRPIEKIVERGGRTIEISNRPLPGGGWISSHEDITAQRLAERRIQEAHSNLLDVIEAMPAGLVMYDDQDRLVLWNRRYDDIYPGTADLRVPGVRFEDMLREGVVRGMYAAARGREEEWLAERLALHAEPHKIHEQRLSNGRWLRVEDRKTTLGGFIGIRVDITELKQREEDLRLQNMKLDTALRHMSQGLVMFDGDRKLVFCNQQYADLYCLPLDLMKSGVTQQQILEHRIARGIIPKVNAEEYFRDRTAKAAAGTTSDTILELSDGRVLSVVIRPMPGGGWVTTHEDITERRRAEAKIAQMAHYDMLTGLPNRVLFGEELDRALARVHGGGSLALLFLDLDHFKRVNDTLGHLAGDELLKIAAERLRRCTDSSDFVARLGGDEFAIIHTSVERPLEPAGLATRISEALKAPFELHGDDILAGVSIGISLAPNDATEREQLLKNADMALYEAKGGGRGTYCFYEPELDRRLKVRQELEVDLRTALVNGEFELHYQPIVNLETGRVSGCEALLRWHHPRVGLIAPATFIPVAEESGLINLLGEFVLRRACADAAAWPDDVKVAVNLSPAQFASGKLPQVVVSALAASGISPGRLELEITETVLMQNTFATLSSLHQLRGLGVRVAMDDFGIGYSSLSYLRSFPFDRIKIDRSFIEDISEKDDCSAIVQAITNLAQRLNITTTAEGVETEEQRAKVRELGCIEMQGHLFSRPRPAREILQFFSRRTHRAVGAASAA
jgi:diguanylate cyclase (GGDEF)-like protein